MSDKSVHLIERAAALLRAARVGNVTTTGLGLELPRDGLVPAAEKHSHLVAERSVSREAGSEQFRTRGTAAAGRIVSDLTRPLTREPVGIAALERAGLMVARTSRTRTTEEYRIVIGRILRALHSVDENSASPSLAKSCLNVVMVTSARPGEGKSFTSLNLGGSIAQNAGESVLVVDVDAKQNSLSDTLGLGGSPGFLDMVANPDLLPDDLIIPSELPNLSFLPLGTRAIVDDGNAGMGLEERLLIPPVKRLAERFNRSLVLLDAPPCLSTSDPHTLSPAVGQVVMVVEAERTQRSEVEAAIDMIRTCPNITMLLNKIRMTSSHTFGTYDYFGSYS